ncbi:ABC transporter permease [Lederbergia sp. NSJ-179]|uniref:ABC transporter permease n=1 Tax=Lederbergia sp. NSJ-179 TaxID=2931402 RepID=UPI001FD14486|nr:ABC transporter permease [Lederbergia sp. NSJ-179]MCJ7840145.1 ABC transporter permease [Lederbergia sp. NSJ-179]
MRNSWKVAKWEIRRNMKNKSFIISLIITPIIFMLFAFIPTLFNSDKETTQVYILDELNVYGQVEEMVAASELNWNLHQTDLDEAAMAEKVREEENTAYIALTAAGLENGKIPVYLNEDVEEDFLYEASILETPLRQLQLERMDLTDKQVEVIGKGVSLEPIETTDTSSAAKEESGEAEGESFDHIVPGIAAGIILFSIVITGMMIFTSASQEKKEKVAEIILSSITPTDLMQGKIIGYFILGITQVAVWLAFLLPIALWKIDFPIIEYLFVPELAVLLVIALAGYLLFSAIFVGMGATVEDMSSTSNFQGIVMMIPFIPFIFMGPIITDPSGVIAKVLTFIPFTTPGVLLIRLTMLEEWPWIEIIIALVVLLISIWLAMKAAGKIFKVGILMYGKNATPKEIWKWLWT